MVERTVEEWHTVGGKAYDGCTVGGNVYSRHMVCIQWEVRHTVGRTMEEWRTVEVWCMVGGKAYGGCTVEEWCMVGVWWVYSGGMAYGGR